MKRMKKWFERFLLAAFVCSLVLLTGCGGGGPAAKKVEYTKGILTETSFESEYIGLRFAAPEGVIMATQEDMDEMIDFGGDVMFSDKDKKMLDYAKANTVYEMMASAPDQTANVFLMVEKLPLSNMTVEQYTDSLKTQLEETGMGYTFADEMSTRTVAGQEYSVVTAEVTQMGVKVKQEYAVRKQDKRIVAMIISSFGDDEASSQQLMSGFSAY